MIGEGAAGAVGAAVLLGVAFLAPAQVERRVDADSFPLLGLHRLDLVDAAVSTGSRWELERNPLKVAWILSHADELGYDEPAGEWLVRRDAYWELYDRFRGSDAAETLAWRAASRPRFGECEGFPPCMLEAVLETVAEYWTRYPAGSHLSRAIEIGGEWSGATLESCRRNPADSGVPGDVIEEVRRSLDEVAPEVRRPILEDLEAIERSCGGEAGGLDVRGSAIEPTP